MTGLWGTGVRRTRTTALRAGCSRREPSMSHTAPPLPRLGKYELKGELGRGAMGVVYEAVDQVLHRHVALKTMTAPLSGKVGTVRFLREARTAGKLHHPNIVTIHELGHDSGTYFIAMEKLEGQTLYDLIAAGAAPTRCPTTGDHRADL